jgi:hypothetical protein
LNPWCVFTDEGRKFVCNLCGFDSDGKINANMLTLIYQLPY